MLATIKSLGYGRRGEEEQQSPVLWPWICRLKEKTKKTKNKTEWWEGLDTLKTLYLQLSDYERVEGVEGGGGQQKSLLHILCKTQMSDRAAYG